MRGETKILRHSPLHQLTSLQCWSCNFGFLKAQILQLNCGHPLRMMPAASALSRRHPLFLNDHFLSGWECQSPLVKWKYTHIGPRNVVRAFATQNNNKKRRNFRNKSKHPTFISEEPSSSIGQSPITSLEVNGDDVDTDENVAAAPRSAILQACTLTSGLLLAIGIVLRQAWPDFRDSTEAANRQILTSLEPLDYVVVACLPGISEELLFRGALMPIFGLNWISALVTGAFFGVLHLGNGRRYSFAMWATFVGIAYGIATIASSSIIVPMVSHSINNIIGGLLWRFTNNSQREI